MLSVLSHAANSRLSPLPPQVVVAAARAQDDGGAVGAVHGGRHYGERRHGHAADGAVSVHPLGAEVAARGRGAGPHGGGHAFGPERQHGG
jgi:hypothetical protein